MAAKVKRESKRNANPSPLELLLLSLSEDRSIPSATQDLEEPDKAALLIWSMALHKKNQEGLLMFGAAEALCVPLVRRMSDDVRLPCMGALLCLTNSAPSVVVLVIVGSPGCLAGILDCLTSSDRERLLETTCHLLAGLTHLLPQTDIQSGTLDCFVPGLVRCLGMKEELTKGMHQGAITALASLAAQEEQAEVMLSEGLLPHCIRLMRDKDCTVKKEALCCLGSLVAVADQRTHQRLLGDDIVDLLLSLCRYKRVDTEGQAAAAGILITLMDLDGEGPSVVMEVVQRRGVETIVGMLPGGGRKGGGKSGRGKTAKKGSGRKSDQTATSSSVSATSPCQAVLLRRVAVLLSRLVLNVDAPPQLMHSQGLPRLAALLHSDDNVVRNLVRQALWNMNYFNLPAEMVDRYSIGADITAEIRDRPLKEVYADHAPLRAFSDSLSRLNTPLGRCKTSAAATGGVPWGSNGGSSGRGIIPHTQERLVLPTIPPPRTAPLVKADTTRKVTMGTDPEEFFQETFFLSGMAPLA